jgi:hypothetical protein
MTFSEEKSRVIEWSAIWEWLSDQDNRDKLTFLGGVLSGGAAAIWAIFKWIVPLIRVLRSFLCTSWRRRTHRLCRGKNPPA